jgi:hypothetical protein
MTDRNVPPVHARTKDEVSDALANDWLRIAPIGERASFAAKIGCRDPKTVSKAISGEHLPEAHTILNSLVADPTALFKVFQLYGGAFVRTQPGEVCDMSCISQMLHAATEYLDRMKDGRRCHVDNTVLAKLFVPLIPAMLAIIREANGTAPEPKIRAVS